MATNPHFLSMLVMAIGFSGCMATLPVEPRNVKAIAESFRLINENDIYSKDSVVKHADQERVVFGIVRMEGSGKLTYMINGRPGPTATDMTKLVISKDGLHHMYGAKIDGRWGMVVDGQLLSQRYDLIAEGTLLSDVGGHYAFGGKVGDKWVVNVDGKEGPLLDGISNELFMFSPNGQRFAYGGVLDEEMFVFVDGIKSQPFKNVGGAVFSADGQRFAFAGNLDRGAMVSIDGKEGVVHSSLGNVFRFSPDGKRFAYAFKKKGQWHLSETDTVYGPYDDIGATLGFYSNDSRHFAFVAMKENEWFVVRDGKEGHRYGGVALRADCFSPDGEHLAYLASGLTGLYTIVDGVEKDHFNQAEDGPFFGPRSQLVSRGRKNGIYFVSVDDHKSTGLKGVGSHAESSWIKFSPDGKRWAWAGLWGNKWAYVVDGVKGIEFKDILGSIAFSPNGKHFAYAGLQGSKNVLVRNGNPGAPFEEAVLGGLRVTNEGVVSVWVWDEKTKYVGRRIEELAQGAGLAGK